MKNNAFAGARIDEKTREPERLAQRKLDGLLSQRSESNCLDRQLDLSADTRFKHFRLVFENEVDGGDSSGCVAQRT
jgi:hypothetical protein